MGIFTDTPKQAYPGSRESIFVCDPEDVVIIGLDTAEDGHELCQDERNQQPLTEEWLANLLTYGCIEPCVVRGLKSSDGKSRVAVVDGRQRVRGVRELNKRLRAKRQPPMTVKIIPEKGKDLTMLDLALRAAACNVHVPESTSFKAKQAAKLLNRGVTKDEAAKAMGVNPRTIDNWMKLLETGEDIQEAVAKGEMPMTAALAVADAPPEVKAKAITKAKAKAAEGDKRRSAKSKAKLALAFVEGQKGLSLSVFRTLMGWVAGKVKDSAVENYIDLSGEIEPATAYEE